MFVFQEARLLTAEDRKKIEEFKRNFLPGSLPNEVLESGTYRIGEDITHAQVQYLSR